VIRLLQANCRSSPDCTTTLLTKATGKDEVVLIPEFCGQEEPARDMEDNPGCQLSLHLRPWRGRHPLATKSAHGDSQGGGVWSFYHRERFSRCVGRRARGLGPKFFRSFRGRCPLSPLVAPPFHAGRAKQALSPAAWSFPQFKQHRASWAEHHTPFSDVQSSAPHRCLDHGCAPEQKVHLGGRP
jgi:hypothetical protein